MFPAQTPSCFQLCTYVSDLQFFPWANQPLGIYRRLFSVDLGVILMAVTYHFTDRETEEHGDMTWPCVRKQEVSVPIPFQDLFSEERKDHGTILILCSSPAADKFSKSQLGAKKACCWLVHNTPGLSNTEVLGLLQAGRPALFQQQKGLLKLPTHV